MQPAGRDALQPGGLSACDRGREIVDSEFRGKELRPAALGDHVEDFLPDDLLGHLRILRMIRLQTEAVAGTVGPRAQFLLSLILSTSCPFFLEVWQEALNIHLAILILVKYLGERVGCKL